MNQGGFANQAGKIAENILGCVLKGNGFRFRRHAYLCDRRDTLIEGARSLRITRQGDYVLVKLDTGYRVEYLGG